MEKQCKHCKTTIHKDATICPHCRGKQPSKSIFGIWSWLALALFVVSVLFGWVPGSGVPSRQSYKEKAELAKSQAENEPLTEKGKRVKAKHQGWSNDICNTVAKKQVFVGMTEEQCRAAWGDPYKINETMTGNHVHQQWVMHENGSSYLYLDDGILRSIQTSQK